MCGKDSFKRRRGAAGRFLEPRHVVFESAPAAEAGGELTEDDHGDEDGTGFDQPIRLSLEDSEAARRLGRLAQQGSARPGHHRLMRVLIDRHQSQPWEAAASPRVSGDGRRARLRDPPDQAATPGTAGSASAATPRPVRSPTRRSGRRRRTRSAYGRCAAACLRRGRHPLGSRLRPSGAAKEPARDPSLLGRTRARGSRDVRERGGCSDIGPRPCGPSCAIRERIDISDPHPR